MKATMNNGLLYELENIASGVDMELSAKDALILSAITTVLIALFAVAIVYTIRHV